jgi:hypothetical protein
MVVTAGSILISFWLAFLRIFRTFWPVRRLHMMQEAQARPQDLVKKIAARAFDLYEARACQDGFDVQDWLQAEREIMLGASEDKLEVSWIEWLLEDSHIDDTEVSRRRAH